MIDIVLSCDKLEHPEEMGSNYDFVKHFASDHIHESTRFEEALRAQVARNGGDGLFNIQVESVPTYFIEAGRLVWNGMSYVASGELVRKVA